jgi:hypothetical protein
LTPLSARLAQMDSSTKECCMPYTYAMYRLSIPFEQIKPDYLLWGCFRSSFASSSTPAGCLLQLIHGLDEGARGAKSHRKKCNKERTDFSIQATLYPDSFRSSLNRAEPVDNRSRCLSPSTACWFSGVDNATTGLHLRRWPR